MSSHDYYGGGGGGHNQPPPQQGYGYQDQNYPSQQPAYGQEQHGYNQGGHSPYPQGQVSASTVTQSSAISNAFLRASMEVHPRILLTRNSNSHTVPHRPDTIRATTPTADTRLILSSSSSIPTEAPRHSMGMGIPISSNMVNQVLLVDQPRATAA